MRLQIDKLGKVAVTVEQGYWDSSKDYDKLTIVEKEGTFGTYISRKPVPTGIPLTNREYWIPFSSLKEEILVDYNKFIDEYGTIIDGHTTSIEDMLELINSNTDAINHQKGLLQILVDDVLYVTDVAGNNSSDIVQLKQSIGKANGLVPLNESAQISSQYLPSYVDDVIDVYSYYNVTNTGVISNIRLFSNPERTERITGEAGKIYQNINEGEPAYQFRWSGTNFIVVGNDPLIIGDITGTAYDGGKGRDTKNTVDSLPRHILGSNDITIKAESDEYNERLILKSNVSVKQPDNTYVETESIVSTIPCATKISAGVMTSEDKRKLDSAADVKDLSNVLHERVIEPPLLDEINILTRETIKKDLFIDMWNEVCGKYGTYNAETGFFELNGFTDITYEEALEIYRLSSMSERNGGNYSSRFAFLKTVRTLLPISVHSGHGDNWEYAFENCHDIQKIVFKPSNPTLNHFGIANCEGMFRGCVKLVTIEGAEIILNNSQYRNNYMFQYCASLEDVRIKLLDRNINFSDSKNLSYETLNFLIANAATTAPRTITVHSDVYAKITDTANTEWNQLLTDAAAKQLSFVTP